MIARTDKGIQSAKNSKGLLATYFYHEVVKFESVEKHSDKELAYVRPLKFKKHILPLPTRCQMQSAQRNDSQYG